MKKLFILIFILCLFGCSHKAREPVTDATFTFSEDSNVLNVETILTVDSTYKHLTVSKTLTKNVKLTEDKENFYIELVPRNE